MSKRPLTEAQRDRLRENGKRGALQRLRNDVLASEGIDRPKPSLPVVKWLERLDPLEPEKETAG